MKNLKSKLKDNYILPIKITQIDENKYTLAIENIKLDLTLYQLLKIKEAINDLQLSLTVKPM